jgi:hypothetical protein
MMEKFRIWLLSLNNVNPQFLALAGAGRFLGSLTIRSRPSIRHTGFRLRSLDASRIFEAFPTAL